MNFENVQNKKEKPIIKFEDLRRTDLSQRDLSDFSLDLLKTVDFDTETIWPDEERLPKGFSPEKLLEEGKNPGLGIKELHEQGIDGSGVVVAIIDAKLDESHTEYKDALVGYKEYGGSENNEISMHGPAVASLLVGKDCGVAPGAKLFFAATPESDSGVDYYSYSEALEEIIKNNENISQEKKVRIVSCSLDYVLEKPEPGLNEWISSIKKARQSGIFVVDVKTEQGFTFSGGGSLNDKDNFDDYLPWLRRDLWGNEVNEAIFEGNVNKIAEKMREVHKDYLKDVSESDLQKMIEKILEERKEEIIIPSDYRTMASSWGKKGQYMYTGMGGISWSVPYLAGLYALALQVNSNIKQEELAEIVEKSAFTNSNGLRIINPKAIIKLVEEKRLNYKK